MLGSIAGCIISISYLVAATELDLDTSKHFTTNHAPVHGYMGRDTTKQGIVMGGITLFVAGYLGAKLIALVVLCSASPLAAIGWCTAESLALFVLRFFFEERIWRFQLRNLPSLIVHGVLYLGMLAAPFPFFR